MGPVRARGTLLMIEPLWNHERDRFLPTHMRVLLDEQCRQGERLPELFSGCAEHDVPVAEVTHHWLQWTHGEIVEFEYTPTEYVGPKAEVLSARKPSVLYSIDWKYLLQVVVDAAKQVPAEVLVGLSVHGTATLWHRLYGKWTSVGRRLSVRVAGNARDALRFDLQRIFLDGGVLRFDSVRCVTNHEPIERAIYSCYGSLLKRLQVEELQLPTPMRVGEEYRFRLPLWDVANTKRVLLKID